MERFHATRWFLEPRNVAGSKTPPMIILYPWLGNLVNSNLYIRYLSFKRIRVIIHLLNHFEDVMAMENNQLKTGTTTIGIVTKEGVVLATEHRATMGNIIAHKDVRKLFKIDENIGLTVAGLVGDAQLLARYIKAEVELYKLKRGVPMSVNSAATLLSNIMRSGGGSYGFYYVGLIMGGIDSSGGHVFGLDSAGGSIRDDFISVGSGSVFAYGVLEDHFKKNMTTDEGINLSIRALNAAMRRDSASGDGFMVSSITKEGYRELSDDEIMERVNKMKLDFPYAKRQ